MRREEKTRIKERENKLETLYTRRQQLRKVTKASRAGNQINTPYLADYVKEKRSTRQEWNKHRR